MKHLIIVKTGQTYPGIKTDHGDFEDWFIAALSHPSVTLTVVNPVLGEALPHHGDGIVLTGSPAMVSDREGWSELTANWIKAALALEIPILGVCYGHQLLAHALGGLVDYHPAGREIGTLQVRTTDAAQADTLFQGLPTRFAAHLTHRQSVLSLPEGATRLAYSEHEPNQAFRVGPHAWGVQFHPEFSSDVMSAYIRQLAPALENEGVSTTHLLESIENTPDARALLERFARLIAER
ncbi:glutamine amidotransferase [Marinobacter caseinilyticus]|uniref:glutamine amidotransferase n=1 Tax=Marinobacter caseinilyticus TaxID=2692195 RepID=UPI001407D243|nr:glutamine amidotransferase [Marinobacter caseinilyticus]